MGVNASLPAEPQGMASRRRVYERVTPTHPSLGTSEGSLGVSRREVTHVENAHTAPSLGIQPAAVWQYFGPTRLGLPAVPASLIPELRLVRPGCVATYEADPQELYLFRHALRRLLDDPTPRVACCHFGHGLNSYAWTYELVIPGLRILAQRLWGGALTTELEQEQQTAAVREIFDNSQMLLKHAEDAAQGHGRDLVLVDSFRGAAAGWADTLDFSKGLPRHRTSAQVEALWQRATSLLAQQGPRQKRSVDAPAAEADVDSARGYSVEPPNEALLDLAKRAVEAWRNAQSRWPDVVVNPSVPVLYFGDLPVYEVARRRVVTVALNPSRAEFPTARPFGRFPFAEDLYASLQTGSLDENVMTRYLHALDLYYDTDPYRPWFASLEPLLSGMDTSYYDGSAGRALHTDLGSPVATDPTWSRLPKETRGSLQDIGLPLWHDLIRQLRPHVILASVARAHLEKIAFSPTSDWMPIYTVERTNPYVVEARNYDLGGHECLFVFGPAANRPFGTVSNVEKVKVGTRIRELLDG